MTQLVFPFTLVPGQPENVNQLNDNLGAIQSVLNGNLGADNIADGALDFPELATGVQNGLVDNLQPGVLGPTDGKVTYASAAGVSVAAGTAWVTNASGLLRRVTWAGNALTVPVSTGTRLDQIVIDSTGTLSRVAGTEQAAGVVTLDNRTGAAALPTGTLRLGDLLITTAGVVNSTSNIRDRRPWARGAFNRIERATNDAGAATQYVAPTTPVTLISATNLQPRIECSGVPIKVTLMGFFQTSFVAPGVATFWLQQDGANVLGTARQIGSNDGSSGVNYRQIMQFEWVVVPTPGSHLFGPAWMGPTTTSVYADGNENVTLLIEEYVRQNANNS